MEVIKYFVDFVIHLDKHLGEIITSYGSLTYLILFIIVFCETGLVVTPFLPGDSLLFVCGVFAANGSLNFVILYIVLTLAAIIGDTVNYWVGHFVGPKVFTMEKSRFFKKEYLERTHEFFEKYGGKTIILARFIPIIRTYAPFVAGIGCMTYSKFMVYNVSGAFLWVSIFTIAGFYFGNIPFIKNNFVMVIMAIIIISIIPIIVEFFQQRNKKSACNE